MRACFSVVIVLATTLSVQSQIVMDHVNPVGASLLQMPNFGINQIFEPEFASFSSAVVDDFISPGGTLSSVSVAFEVTDPNLNVFNVQGWRVSVWTSLDDAAQSGSDLNLHAEATILIPHALGSTSRISTGSSTVCYRTDLPVGINVNPGRRFICVTPVLPFTGNGQVFILRQLAPALLGAGTQNDSKGINPGAGFGLGNIIQNSDNAALRVEFGTGGGSGFLERVKPYDYNILLGRRSAGDLQSLKNVDLDALRVCRFIVPNTTVAPVSLELIGRSSFNFSNRLVVRTQTRAGSAGQYIQTTHLFNYTNGAYDANPNQVTIDGNWFSNSFDSPSPAFQFFSATKDLRAKLSFRPAGPTAELNFCVDIDSVNWDLYN